jgi:sugar phosphate isomerase/epimerase
MATFSAFADEISSDPEEQVAVLRQFGIRHLDLRGAWNKSIMDLTESDLDRLGRILADSGVGVAAIGSPIGKSTIDKPPEYELKRLKHACELAQRFRSHFIRIFSFYPPEGKPIVAFRQQVFERMASWVEYVTSAHPGLVLAHENESGIYGDLPNRCEEICSRFAGPGFTGCFDFANFIHDGVDQPYESAWKPLKPYIGYFHLKDYKSGAHPVPLGEGNGEVERILGDAAASGYDGFLSLEPHLAQAGQFRGFTGPELFRKAVEAARKVCARAGMRVEQRTEED